MPARMKPKAQPWQQKRSVSSCLARSWVLGLAKGQAVDALAADQAYAGGLAHHAMDLPQPLRRASCHAAIAPDQSCCSGSIP